MMSMSGGWFFVVAAEAISVGDVRITLPGVGSYVALAIQQRDLGAVGWAVLAMSATILAYDQVLFRPLVVWAERFRVEQSASQIVGKSFIYSLFEGASGVRRALSPIGRMVDHLARARLALPDGLTRAALSTGGRRVISIVWFGAVAMMGLWGGYALLRFEAGVITVRDLGEVLANGGLTLLRVSVLIVLASLIWTPVGIWVGLNPRLSSRVQPVAQFLAAFPANLLFPAVVYLLVHFHANPTVWLSPLMILGAQWYILFNVIAGASAFPTDFREAATMFHIHGWRWWRDVMLPGVFPYFVTGAITASGGAWNASIVAEAVSWGATRLNGSGLGAYIAQMTARGDYPRIILGVALMSLMVIAMNRLVWRPLYALAERRARLD